MDENGRVRSPADHVAKKRAAWGRTPAFCRPVSGLTTSGRPPSRLETRCIWRLPDQWHLAGPASTPVMAGSRSLTVAGAAQVGLPRPVRAGVSSPASAPRLPVSRWTAAPVYGPRAPGTARV